VIKSVGAFSLTAMGICVRVEGTDAGYLQETAQGAQGRYDACRIRPKRVEKTMNAVIDVHKLIPAWQALQSAAPLAHIESEADYEQATALLNSLLDAVRDDASHPLYSLISVVGDLIEAYEIEQEPRLR
jgi:HTH-type transcriptional regulator / antitoxin HigA